MASADNKLQEMQFLEQNLQNILFQKQAFQIELNENSLALKEITKTKDDIFKIVGQLMIKTDKSEIDKELQNKQKILELRIKTLEKQEKTLTEHLEKIREDLFKDTKKQNKN